MTLEKIASEYFKTNIPLQITPEEEVKTQQSEVWWLCEASFAECEEPFSQDTEGASHTESASHTDKDRDHDHLTGHYRGAAHSTCNINETPKQSSFNSRFFHNFSGYDCHLIIEPLLTQACKMGYEPKRIPMSMENYVSVRVGCLRFSDSFRFLPSSLDK